MRYAWPKAKGRQHVWQSAEWIVRGQLQVVSCGTLRRCWALTLEKNGPRTADDARTRSLLATPNGFPYLRGQINPMNRGPRFKLFLMMVLEIAIWGAWQVQIFNYMPMLKFEQWQQNLAGSMFAIASVVGIFFSNQFADRNFSAEKFLAFSHLVGGLALLGAVLAKEFIPFFLCFLLYGLFYVPTISVTGGARNERRVSRTVLLA